MHIPWGADSGWTAISPSGDGNYADSYLWTVEETLLALRYKVSQKAMPLPVFAKAMGSESLNIRVLEQLADSLSVDVVLARGTVSARDTY